MQYLGEARPGDVSSVAREKLLQPEAKSSSDLQFKWQAQGHRPVI